jgi:hypothetical protein
MSFITSVWSMINYGGILGYVINGVCALLIFNVFKHMGDEDLYVGNEDDVTVGVDDN